MGLFLFKFATIFILVLFALFVSDIRKKPGMLPIIKKHILLLIKMVYIVPIFVFIYPILKLENIYLSSYLGLVANLIGTLLVIKAKLDLGKYHAWAGHILSSTKIIKKGIYSYIRHPLYAGIHLFIFGGILIGINNHPFSLFELLKILFLIFVIIFFLNISALKENKYLHEKFGEDYLKYKEQVHAFLPIKKYSFDENS